MTHALTALLLAAAVAAARPAPVVRAGDPGPDRPAVRLATADDLTGLCVSLQPAERIRPRGDAVERGEAETRHEESREAALAQRYEVVVPAAGLVFAPYDGPERRLALAEPVQIAVEGTARLWPTEARALPVEVDAAGARRVLDAQRSGTLALVLTFDLPDDATCGTGARGKKFTIPIDPVSWRWVDGGTTALAHGGAGADRPLLTVAQGARPKVDVGEPIAGPAEAKKAVAAHAAELEACYAEALKRDPRIDGVLVADIGGKRAAIAADSVGDADFAACVQKALGPLAPARGGKVVVPIRFGLEPPGAAKDPVKAP